MASEYKRIDGAHFVIEASEPAQTATGHKFRSNITYDTLCPSAERAIEMLKKEHPNATVHVVRHVGSRKSILVDLSLFKDDDG